MEQKPTDMLEDEHRVILKVAAVMAGLLEDLTASRPVDADALRDIVSFMRTYADKCHHGKEETYLFTLLAAKGVPTQGCPLQALLAEHQVGRALVADLARRTEAYAAAAPDARQALTQTLRCLLDLYPSHIWKEDYLLFPMTNTKILSLEDQAALYERFVAVDVEMGKDLHPRFEQLATDLEKRVRGA